MALHVTIATNVVMWERLNTGCLGRLPMVLSNLHTIKTFNCLILSDLAKTMEVSTSLTNAMHPGVSETNAQHSGSNSEAFANNQTTYTCTFSGHPSTPAHAHTTGRLLCAGMSNANASACLDLSCSCCYTTSFYVHSCRSWLREATGSTILLRTVCFKAKVIHCCVTSTCTYTYNA